MLRGKRLGLFFILLLVLVVEVCSRSNVLNSLYVPPPSQISESTIHFWPELLRNVYYTLGRLVGGYVIAIVVAIPIGVAMGESDVVYGLLEPLVELLIPMPSALIPIALLLLGVGENMRLSVIVFGSIWPTLVAAMESVRRVDRVLRDTGRTLGLNQSQILRLILLPATLPSVVTGMRIILAIGLITLAITVEMIAGGVGLGFFILEMERSFRFSEMYAGIAAAALVGYLTNLSFVILSNRSLRWSLQMNQLER